MKLTVTAEDVEGAVPMDGSRCPVARAFRRTLGVPRVITVSTGTLVYNTDPFVTGFDVAEKRVFNHSKTLSKAIVRFDRGEPFKPATFIVTPR